ncbi:MAG: cation:dicarboxylase symporter family transporter [Ignavibacteria bacterium]|nr:cation:dicarboxylase symporter family transporter [Ignavibacteria bacterium]
MNIENWTQISFLKRFSFKIFDGNSQLAVIKYFNSLKDKKVKESLILKIKFADSEEQVYGNIKGVGKVRTIGVMLKPIGDIFIRLLTMIAVPLVLASLIVGAASLSDLKHIAKIGGKTIGFYAMTAVIAIAIGLACANIIQPGKFMPEETKERLLETYQDDAMSKIEQNVSMDIVDFIVNMVPKNPFNAISEGNFLQIVFFSILMGIFLSQIDNEKSKTVINFFDGISSAMILLVEK